MWKKLLFSFEVIAWRVWGYIRIWCGIMSIEELLKDLEYKILRIKKRYYYLDAILKQLVQVTGGKQFIIRNDFIYQMIWDSYEMLIIELASLYRGMCQPGGFFGQLKIHAAKLRTTSHKKIEVSEPNISGSRGQPLTPQDHARLKRELKVDTQKFIAKGIEESLLDLFPDLKNVSDKRANHSHVDALKDQFWKLAEEMVHDRDARRAHKHEHKEHSHAENSKEITLKDIGTHFDRLEKIINAIRSVTTLSSFAYLDMNEASVANTAEDVVDLVMMGRFNEVFNTFEIPVSLKKVHTEPPYFYMYRDRYYQANPQPWGKDEKDLKDE
ncbi:MAG: hypothetical protein KA715_10860 [Xanthomonadaceae bacterium]|nr:hypothetical protein [Xanthomonadaceae bacterium]